MKILPKVQRIGLSEDFSPCCPGLWDVSIQAKAPHPILGGGVSHRRKGRDAVSSQGTHPAGTEEGHWKSWRLPPATDIWCYPSQECPPATSAPSGLWNIFFSPSRSSMQTFLYLDERVACAFSSNVGSIDPHYRIRAEGRVQGRQDFMSGWRLSAAAWNCSLRREKEAHSWEPRGCPLLALSNTQEFMCLLMNTQSDPFMGKWHLKIRGLGVQLSRYCWVCRKSWQHLRNQCGGDCLRSQR